MPYKISGTLSDAARIIVFKESNWSIESNTTKSSGAYEVDELVSGAKLIVARKSDGESLGFGNVSGEYYAPTYGDRGIFAARDAAPQNIISYITISSAGNATDFGDLSGAANLQYHSATSNSTNNRALFNRSASMTYVTITSTGNAAAFGNSYNNCYNKSGCSNGTTNRGVFGAGNAPKDTNAVMEYRNISVLGDAVFFGNLWQDGAGHQRGKTGACSNLTNDRGVFGGGQYSGSYFDVIDYITISSTGNSTNFGDLTQSRDKLDAASNGISNRGLFAGGYTGAARINTIDYITITSTGNATNFGDMTSIRMGLAATSNAHGDRAVFAGGRAGGANIINVIDYVTISNTGNATDFGDLTHTSENFCATSNG